MATYKFEVLSRFGKFHAVFYEATSAKPEITDTAQLESINDVLGLINGEIEKLGLDEKEDSIIFRNIAYDDFQMLTRQIKMGTY